MNADISGLSDIVDEIINSHAMRASIFSLPKVDVQQFMTVLQMLIGRDDSRRRLFERFVRTLVTHTGTFPEDLFVAGAKRVGKNPHSGGGFADVWRGESRGRPVAMKVLRIYQCSKSQLETVHRNFCAEAMLWQQLRHKNILPFYGVCKDEFAPMLAMISPWMGNGTLTTHLEERNLDAFGRREMLKGVACGLQYLHSCKPAVVHGDLRAGNVLVDSDGIPRIGDFGLARIIDSQSSSVVTVATSFNGKGTMRWQAPELLNASRFEVKNSGVTVKSDVYAFAWVCWEIFTGQVPFPDLRDGEVILAVAVRDQRPSRPAEPATSRGFDDEHWKLMQSCWATLAVDRPTMDEVTGSLECIFCDTVNSAIQSTGQELPSL
ncbi:kinase-like protein [Rickenella mellea]|uniref:Kinase-like protein n=1 Tax=Rickenella mellea TaxID=50990 RepID=A0A4Y7Q010_9AGAM|nr:kinase-like protein [Rickenella mellea]